MENIRGTADLSSKDLFLKVEGIHCQSCIEKVSRSIEESKLADSYWVDLATSTVRLRRGHRGVSDKQFLADISARLRKIGYKPSVIADPTHSHASAWVLKMSAALVGLLFSLFFFPHESVPFTHSGAFRLFFIVALFVFSAEEFFSGAWSSARKKNFTVDTLVSLGAGAAAFLSLALIVTQIPGHLYWVEAFAVLLLVSVGHYIENVVLVRADKTLRSLMVLAPEKALKVFLGTKDVTRSMVEVAVAELQVGDHVQLRPGDRVAVDGKIIEGKSDIDESLLTGESMPLSKGPGDKILSGTMNLSGAIIYEVEKTGQDTVLSQIISTVIRVRQTRANIQRFADTVSNIFVPVVVLLALLSFFLWYFSPSFMNTLADQAIALFGLHGMQPTLFWKAFSAALSVLVISCPCALGLATPAALMAVSGLAAKHGILIRDARAIENAEKITHIFFDKTGTLSGAHPVLVDTWKTAAFDAKWVGAVVQQSRHPLSQALQKNMPASSRSVDIKEIPGEGVRAQGEGIDCALGNRQLMERFEVKGMNETKQFIDFHSEQGHSLAFWSQNGHVEAAFAFEDKLREGAAELLRSFGQDLEVRVLSGDNKRVLQALAARLKINPTHVYGELSPIDKVQILQSYQQQGYKVAFVGDGLNDAPVLQAADLGIAVGSASDLAKQSADIVLLKTDLASVRFAFDLAKRGMKTIRQNLFWAFIYNVVAIPIAFFGLINPVVCTLSMAFSDFVIIANSIRVFVFNKRQDTLQRLR